MKSYLHLFIYMEIRYYTNKTIVGMYRKKKTENNCLNFKIPTLTLESIYYGPAVYTVFVCLRFVLDKWICS